MLDQTFENRRRSSQQ